MNATYLSSLTETLETARDRPKIHLTSEGEKNGEEISVKCRYTTQLSRDSNIHSANHWADIISKVK